MEILNYLASLFLIIIGGYLKYNPSFLKTYNKASIHPSHFPAHIILWGFFITGCITPIIAYNLRFLGYDTTANFTFVISIPLGIFLTNRYLKKQLKNL